MMKYLHCLTLALVSAGVVACGDDDEENAAGRAAHICSEQIACGYQAADQRTCEQLFETFFSPAQLQTCDACVTAEECATEQDVCSDACTL